MSKDSVTRSYRLPDASQLGDTEEWQLPDRAGDSTSSIKVVKLRAWFIGFGTSGKSWHTDHDEEYAPQGTKCNACRWFEVMIFHVEHNRYAVLRVGRSAVPDEVDFPRLDDAYSPHHVIEKLIEHPRPGSGGRTQPFLTAPVRDAIAVAAGYDDDMADMYDDFVGPVAS